MTLYLNFRSQGVAGSIVDPYLIDGARSVDWSQVEGLVRGKDVLLGVHGFNYSLKRGMEAFAAFDQQLQLSAAEFFIGVLWPGDFWIPFINYPFEGDDAMECGRRLATFCVRWLRTARSISFVSHSLGARVVLEAAAKLNSLSIPARMICLTAAAINRDCLTGEYKDAVNDMTSIHVLASRYDTALRIAFQIGDPIANALHHDHEFFRFALGFDGPPASPPHPVKAPWQIQEHYEYDHGYYLPPTNPPVRSQRVADYVRRALRGQPQPYPGALD